MKLTSRRLLSIAYLSLLGLLLLGAVLVAFRTPAAPAAGSVRNPLAARQEVRRTRRVVRGRRRRVRMAAVAKGPKVPEASGGHMQSASDTPSSHLWALWRCALCSAVATAGRPRHKRVVAERKAKGGLGRPVSHPEHGDTPIRFRDSQ